jgi:Z1 domain
MRQNVLARLLNSRETALNAYLAEKEQDYVRQSGPDFGPIDMRNLRVEVEHVLDRIENYLEEGPGFNDTQLVLGEIQSGKTAHMLGVIAGLVGTSTSLCILISGASVALNRQTRFRVEEDLQSIPSAVKLFDVPTRSQVPNWTDLHELKRSVGRRLDLLRDSDEDIVAIPPLPVLVVLESTARVEALRLIIENLSEPSNEQLNIVIIDDEADQLSQNSGSRRRRISRIHGELTGIVDSGVKNCLLAYTATPQAILLTERQGRLRPRLCSVISPGIQYFGLKELMESPESQRVEIPEYDPDQVDPHISLRQSILRFLIKGMIAREKPEVFWGCDPQFAGLDSPDVKSVQMMVNPSKEQEDHEKFHRWIRTILDDFELKLGEGYRRPNEVFVKGELQETYAQVRLQLDDVNRRQLPEEIPDDWVHRLGDSVSNSTQLVLVNSSQAGESLPTDSDQWANHNAWVIVGGDILGRGVTLPALLTSYFLRSPNAPQVDTLSQQMRFCGYRRRYRSFVDVWAPEVVFDAFRDMVGFGTVLFTYAKKWDRDEVDLSRVHPQPAFVGEMRPTRPAVWDPGLRLSPPTDTPFQTRVFKHPELAHQNARLIGHMMSKDLDSEPYLVTTSGWNVYESDVHFARRIFNHQSGWKCSGRDRRKFEETGGLFDGELGPYGLADHPFFVVVRDEVFINGLSDGDIADIQVGRRRNVRLPQGVSAGDLLKSWLEAFGSSRAGPREVWFDSLPALTIVGGSNRTVQGELRNRSLDPTLLFIEPFKLVGTRAKPGGQDSETLGTFGYALAMSVLAPDGFRISYWTL